MTTVTCKEWEWRFFSVRIVDPFSVRIVDPLENKEEFYCSETMTEKKSEELAVENAITNLNRSNFVVIVTYKTGS